MFNGGSSAMKSMVALKKVILFR